MNRTFLYILICIILILACENALENVLAIVAGTHMHPHVVGVFAEKKDMIAENESHLLIEFKNAIKTSEKEAAERAEFFLIFKYNFVSIYANVMEGSEHINEMVKPKIFRFLRSFIIFFIDFLNDSVGYHVI